MKNQNQYNKNCLYRFRPLFSKLILFFLQILATIYFLLLADHVGVELGEILISQKTNYKYRRFLDVNFLAKKKGEAEVVSDKGVVTFQAAPTETFNEAFRAAIAQHRHWIREENENMPA
jgi:hypothetical protein